MREAPLGRQTDKFLFSGLSGSFLQSDFFTVPYFFLGMANGPDFYRGLMHCNTSFRFIAKKI